MNDSNCVCVCVRRDALKTQERLEELDRLIAACDNEMNSVLGIATSAGKTAVPQLKNEHVAPSFLSPEYLENARRFMSFLQEDVTATSTRRNALWRERSGLWKQ